MRWVAPLSRRLLGLLVVLAAVAVIAQHGSLPHRHTSTGPALFNQEHDLTLLATGGTAALTDTAPILVTVLLVACLAVRAPRRPAFRPCRGADSRAPPSR